MDWYFDVVRAAGYTFDSSVPADRVGPPLKPAGGSGEFLVRTQTGLLVEVPVSSMGLMGSLAMPLGGGYLRLLPWSVLQRVSRQIRQSGRPLVLYIHPRDVDPESPCLPLGPWRRFKFTVNRRSTLTKLHALLTRYDFTSIVDLNPSREERPARPSLPLAGLTRAG